MDVGIEAELGALFAIAVLGTSFFARFEVETPPLRKVAKWAVVAALTLGTYAFAGHWALALLGALTALGLGVHFIWCRRNGIDPLTAEPLRRYYELRGWTLPGA